ncbi:DUF2796 domain-containing protein [Litoricolaceae bacterium]|nr:DUF2796 domain-containing protein [Litorivicinaceae bacterium]
MRCIPMTLAITLISSFALAEQRHASSHVHGLNHATVVLEGNSLQISYEFPAEQLSEHEHDEHKHDEHKHDEHKHDEQGDKNHALSEKLEAIDSVFAMVRLPKNAQCKETKVTHSVTQVASNDKEHTSHYDALIESTLECSAPNNLTNISFEPAFERFNDLEKIEVEGLLGTRALSETFTVTSSSLAL